MQLCSRFDRINTRRYDALPHSLRLVKRFLSGQEVIKCAEHHYDTWIDHAIWMGRMKQNSLFPAVVICTKTSTFSLVTPELTLSDRLSERHSPMCKHKRRAVLGEIYSIRAVWMHPELRWKLNVFNNLVNNRWEVSDIKYVSLSSKKIEKLGVWSSEIG